ncbi:MAG: hypothetical protein IM671_09345 [Phenylobacterium sp.]|uniref:hypothetical protein n=1 Tax=Phenylobacterium sp. TaxID=1871053 RepID=UPI0025E1A251|nr:hypothetical protein [Phenylobacterium sp.]MCA3502499.1 hypothetical protein [Rhodobacter sp.]MCA6246910.1 hypothetical protein [Phenylobacterium sp.]MCA6254459.1 hypothetical protein [Phenylobacterium sp.]
MCADHKHHSFNIRLLRWLEIEGDEIGRRASLDFDQQEIPLPGVIGRRKMHLPSPGFLQNGGQAQRELKPVRTETPRVCRRAANRLLVIALLKFSREDVMAEGDKHSQRPSAFGRRLDPDHEGIEMG